MRLRNSANLLNGLCKTNERIMTKFHASGPKTQKTRPSGRVLNAAQRPLNGALLHRLQ